MHSGLPDPSAAQQQVLQFRQRCKIFPQKQQNYNYFQTHTGNTHKQWYKKTGLLATKSPLNQIESISITKSK